MQGLTQGSPLTVDRLLRHAAGANGQAEVVTAAPEGAPRRLSYIQLDARVRRLAGALVESGVRSGDVVAAIGCGTARQLEAWFAVMMTGAACHPINPSLPSEQTAALLRAHGDKVVLVDPDLLAALEPSLLKLPQLERVIAMGEAAQDFDTRMHAVVSQDALLETAGAPLWGATAGESQAALLVHSALSATATPWSHRHCVLQALAARGADGLRLTADDTLLVLVPVWRAAAAAALFAAPAAGCKLVLPGPRTDVQQTRILADRETATVVLASPAQLQALHDQFRAEGRKPIAVKRVIATGAPCPQALVRAWRDSFGIELSCAWGSAEVAGLAALGQPPSGLLPLFGIELELLDADGRPRPHDGVAIGRLSARGPLVAGASGAAHLDTGDLATIDSHGRVGLLGRADEQIIASGAQIPAWPVEAAALEHPATAQAAAIDSPRGLDADGPVLVVERKPGALAGKPEYLRFLGERLGGLKLGELLFVNGFPMDAAGRIDKPLLRKRLEQLISPPPPVETAPSDIWHEPARTPPPEPVAVPAPEPELEPVSAPDAAPEAVAVEPEPLVAGPEPALSSPEPEVLVPAFALAAAAAPVLFKDEPAGPEGEAPSTGQPQESGEPDAPVEPEAPPELDEPAEPHAHAEPPEPADLLAETAEAAPEPVDETLPALEPAETSIPESTESDLLTLGPLSARPPIQSADTAAEAEPSMFLRLDAHPHQDRRKSLQRVGRTELFLNLAGLLALAPVVMILVGALGVRFDLIDWRVGVGQLILDWPSKLALIAVLGGIFAIFAAVPAGFAKYGLRAAFSLALPLATLAALAWLKSLGDGYPPIHDVATDWTQPIVFSPALLRERGPDAYPVENDSYVPAASGAYMNRRVAEVNSETCPAAKPAIVPAPPVEAYARAKAALVGQGLALFREAPAEGRLEATATGQWLGMKDDVAVRITPSGTGSRVDVRSVSRGGVADYGANCRRVTNLVRQVAGQPPSA